MSDGATSGLSKAELRKQARAAKKELKEKAKEKKTVECHEKEPGEPKKSPRSQQQYQKPKQPEPKKLAEKPATATTTRGAITNSQSPAPESHEPVKPIVTMFQSDFPEDWTSGAVPLLAAIGRLIDSVSRLDDHDCRLASASLKSKYRISEGDELLLRHFDEIHLRPFLAMKLGLVFGLSPCSNSEGIKNSENAPRKTLVQVGHLAVVKWVRELMTLKADESFQQKSSQGVLDFLSSLTDSLMDMYVERIQLAADSICRFACEMLSSCTTFCSTSPVFPFENMLSSPVSAIPSNLIVTLASCHCNTAVGETSSSCEGDKQVFRPPVISHLITRALALLAESSDISQFEPSGEDVDSDNLSDIPCTRTNVFQPPCLTVAVATPGCCANSYQQACSSLFDEGEMGCSSSLVVFPVPLSRLGSAITTTGQVAAVVLPAEAVLANRGSAVLAPRGAGLLTLAARKQWNCPVLVLAETYKIIAGGQDEIEDTLKSLAQPRSHKTTVELYTEDSDVISADSISVVVTELGPVPAAALPSILRLSQRARHQGKGISAKAGTDGHRKESEQIDSPEVK